MVKKIVLSLVHNASTQINNELVALNDDILFLQNEFRISENKKVQDLVKRKFYIKEKEKYKKLSEFLTKYVTFLLDKNRNNESTYCIYSHFIKEKNGEIRNLIKDMNNTITNNENSNTKLLNNLCKKRNKLRKILHLIKICNIKNLSDEKLQDIFSDLIFQLKSSNRSNRKNLFSMLLRSGEKCKLKMDEASNEEGVIGVSTGKKFADCIITNDSNVNTDGDENVGTDNENSSQMNLSSTEASVGVEENSSIDQMSYSEEVNDPPDVYTSDASKGENSGNDLLTNENIFERGNILNGKYHAKHYSLTKHFLNNQERNGCNYSLMNKFNSMRKCFSNTEKVVTPSIFNNDKGVNYNEGEGFTWTNERRENGISILVKSLQENMNNILSRHMNTETLEGHIKSNPNLLVKYMPPSINKSGKNVYTKKGNDKPNDERVKKHNRSNFSGSASSSSSCSSSSSSSSSCDFFAPKGCNGEKASSCSNVRKKKYIFRINKKGNGTLQVKKEGQKSANCIYHFEMIYDDDVGDSAGGDKARGNDAGDDNAGEKNESKNKRLVRVSFLIKGGKICRVKNLHVAEDKFIRNLNFCNICTDRSANVKKEDAEWEERDKSRMHRRKENFEMESKKRINMLEENLKNLREENFRKKYELTRIIDDMKFGKTKGTGNTLALGLDEEMRSYNMEFIETNRLRGLYIHMLDTQNQLERDKNFYKNELEKLQEDIKNNTAPISDFLKEEKIKFMEREKELYKKEKKYFHIKNQLKKKVAHLQNELELTEEKLKIEKEINKSLNSRMKEKIYILEKNESERRNSDMTNESKIHSLNIELNQLMNTMSIEKKEKTKLQNEISLLKKDMTFDNFRKVVLNKVTKTNDDIKHLAEILEMLTKELENKISKENINDRHVLELKEECKKKIYMLNAVEAQMNNDKKKMKKMSEEIAYLREKNKNLVECVKYMINSNGSTMSHEHYLVPKDGYYFSLDDGEKKVEKGIHRPMQTTSRLTKSNNLEMAHYNRKEDDMPDLNIFAQKKGVAKNSRSYTSFSDNSSLFLCHNMETKREASTYEELL
ncbi:hypothetical protein, conserved [Plasmodium gonderi]|uniref:Uncharacterized protein n=1 Tax=Plasmodium gonderi TaxID=77519 RepID=A0A1Y1JFU2_PLAGO|nr:hypothetical protein, conserved [Plasmodium gonderi]GAW80205.1 hypothetical protein, conserved [Plasmodium gonderi]